MIRVQVVSYGRAIGAPPAAANVVVDARCVPDPIGDRTDLWGMTGLDPDIARAVLASPAAVDLVRHTVALTHHQIARARAGGRDHLVVVAVGCTAGQHRSVVIAEQIARTIARWRDVRVAVVHRDLEASRRSRRVDPAAEAPVGAVLS